MKEDWSFLLDVQLVHDPVHERRQHQRGGSDEEQPGEQGISRGEQLACVSRDRINRAHATENHRGIHESIDPRKAPEEMVAEHSNTQSDDHHEHRQADKAHNPDRKSTRLNPVTL